MSRSAHTDPLPTALDDLAALAGDADRAVLAEIRSRLSGLRLRVLVAGEAKRGKSTLVNALLGRELLPTGVTPLTALATTVRHGADEHVTAVFTDGRAERLPLTALADLVTERGNPGNRRGVASVTVHVGAPLLARGVELVDTPGTGSVHAHNTAEALTALDAMDAAVFVLTADPPVSASERDLMARVAGLSVTMFVVLNKADYLAGAPAPPEHTPGPRSRTPAGQAPDELAEALEFAARVTAGVAGRPVRVYPVSARSALAGSDPGFAVFAADLASYLDTGGAADLRASAVAHARRIAQSLRDEVDLARRAAGMRSGEAALRVAEFGARLATVAQRRRDATDLAQAEAARLLTGLNEAAGQAEPAATARVAARLAAMLDRDLRSAPAARIEREGRDRLAALAVAEAEAWRRGQAARLEGGLGRLDERLTSALRAELDGVRNAAAELLGVDLTVPSPGERLAPDLRFFYQVAEEAGQTELLAGAVRRRLPGEAGRRRARAFLDRELADLVPRQIGRARADLQYRLAEAARLLAREVTGRYERSTGRLQAALHDAASLRVATDEEVAARDAGLAARRAAIGHVLALLDGAATAPEHLPDDVARLTG